MKKRKILCVFGTRPEAIKIAPVLKQLRAHPSQFSIRVCVTGQHRHLLDQVLDLFGIRSDYDLNIMKNSQSLTHITTSVMKSLEPILSKERPDWMLVQGDTTTAMAASLVAFYGLVKVAHVEAGLRTWDKKQPFPEEMNRKVVDAVSDLYFAPTQMAKQNLIKEGFSEKRIWVTGNTVIDALLDLSKRGYAIEKGPLKDVPFHKAIVLVTAHRRENFGKPLENICKAIKKISTLHPDNVQIVYPVHRNPNVWFPVHSSLGGKSNITLLPPLDYQAFIYLVKQSRIILTDSGGLQEEAPSLGKPVLVLRDVTERPEAVEAGTVKVVGTNPNQIVRQACLLLEDKKAYALMAHRKNPYGDGKASLRIIKVLHSYPSEKM